jgi:hypothetical protein
MLTLKMEVIRSYGTSVHLRATWRYIPEDGNIQHEVRFEVFTAVTMKNGVFWVVTPCGSWYFFAAYVGY